MLPPDVTQQAVPDAQRARLVLTRDSCCKVRVGCRNENFWLAFTFPGMDSWMGTNPASKDVPMTDMARNAVRGRDDAKQTQR